jgi:hypothetical protein
VAVETDTMGAADEDRAVAVLEDVAEAADSVADEQRRIAREARSLASARRRGVGGVQLMDGGGGRVLKGLRRSGMLLLANARRLQAVLARTLADDGLTTRQIGARFGVSHQRISALMAPRDD